MGAWGMRPFQNDSAHEVLWGLFRHVELAANCTSKRRAQRNYDRARAAIALLAYAGRGDKMGAAMLRALFRIRSDVEWLAMWNRPRAMIRVLGDEIDETWDAVKREIPRAEYRKLLDEMSAALSVTLPRGRK